MALGLKGKPGPSQRRSVCQPELKCFLLDDKESQMFEEGHHSTQCVCVSFHKETIGKRQRAPDGSQRAAGQKALGRGSPQSHYPNVGMKPEQPETSLFVVSTKLATIILFCFYFQLRNYQCGVGVPYVWYIVIKIKQQLRPGAHMCRPPPPSCTHRTTVSVASLFLSHPPPRSPELPTLSV